MQIVMCSVIAGILLAIAPITSSAEDKREGLKEQKVWFKEAQESLSPTELKKFNSSLLIYGATDDPAEALDILSPLLQKETLHWAIRYYAGNLMLGTKDFAGAVRQYELALDALGRDVVDVNIPWRLGQALLKSGKADDAILSLEQATQFPGYLYDPKVYFDLAKSYEASGQYEDAARSYGFLRVLDPLNPDFRKVHPPLQQSSLNPDIPILNSIFPTIPEVVYHLVDSIGEPSLKDMEIAVSTANTLAKAVSVLETNSITEIAEQYRTQIISFLFLADVPTKEITFERALATMGKMRASLYFQRASVEVRAIADLYEARLCWHLSKLLQSISLLDSYHHRIDPKSAASTSEIRKGIQRMAFAKVSFDDGGIPRTQDPDRFLDPFEVGVPLPRDLHHAPSGNSRNDKYSSVSSTEDWVNTITIFGMRKSVPDFENKLRAIIEKRMGQRKFDIPVKFILHSGADSFLDTPTSDGKSTLRDRLDREIRRKAHPTVPKSTLEAYAIGVKVRSLNQYLQRTGK